MSLTLGARTLPLHAKHLLPEYISTMLLPFALMCYEDQMNNLKHNNDGFTPYQKLAGLDASLLKMSDYHTFGCPAYVLDSHP